MSDEITFFAEPEPASAPGQAPAASDATLVSVPIIIHPQVAVVSLGAVRRVPVVVGDGADAHLGIGRRVVVGISFDHRVCDPTAATRYLERVGELLAGLDVASER